MQKCPFDVEFNLTLLRNMRPHEKQVAAECGAGYFQRCVYLLEGENGLYKIGYSTSLNSRISELRRQTPWDFNLIHVIVSADPLGAERDLHRMYRSKHSFREWFMLTPEDVAEIKAIGFGQL